MYDATEREDDMNDTIKPATVYHLQEPIESITATSEIPLNDIGIVGDLLRFSKRHLQKEAENKGIAGI